MALRDSLAQAAETQSEFSVLSGPEGAAAGGAGIVKSCFGNRLHKIKHVDRGAFVRCVSSSAVLSLVPLLEKSTPAVHVSRGYGTLRTFLLGDMMSAGQAGAVFTRFLPRGKTRTSKSSVSSVARSRCSTTTS